MFICRYHAYKSSRANPRHHYLICKLKMSNKRIVTFSSGVMVYHGLVMAAWAANRLSVPVCLQYNKPQHQHIYTNRCITNSFICARTKRRDLAACARCVSLCEH